MSKPLRPAALCLVAGAVLAAIGCTEDNRGLVKVRGAVSYDGVPVTVGRIAFVPVEPGRPSQGRIQPDGTYELSTYERGDGAPAGEYRVRIESYEVIGDTGEYDPRNPPKKKWMVPPRYASELSAGLSATVEPGSSQKIDFDVPAE